MRGLCRAAALCVGWVLSAGQCAGQAAETSVEAAFRSLQTQAEVAFVGQVIAVRPLGGTVEIDFRVDESFKGNPGGHYALREWAGLWAAGQRRFWVGECALVFLHGGARAGGLGSPAGGMDGVLPMFADGSADAVPQIDIGRLRTRVLRRAGEPLVAANAVVPLTAVRALLRGAGGAGPWLPRTGDPALPVRRVIEGVGGADEPQPIGPRRGRATAMEVGNALR